MASLLERLRSSGVSAAAVEALECAGLGDAALLAVGDPAAFTAAEELGIDAADARALAAALATIRGEERGPLIFLDVDGVLNRTVRATHVRLEPELCGRLAALVARTGARLVYSTFWREHAEYLTYLCRCRTLTSR